MFGRAPENEGKRTREREERRGRGKRRRGEEKVRKKREGKRKRREGEREMREKRVKTREKPDQTPEDPDAQTPRQKTKPHPHGHPRFKIFACGADVLTLECHKKRNLRFWRPFRAQIEPNHM